MIYDGLDVIERYRGLSRGLDVLIDWLGKNDPKDLPLGRTEIDGSRVFANVMEAKTKRREDARFEFHHRYADVQIDLEGEERFFTTPGATDVTVEYDETADKGHCLASEGNDDILSGTLAHDHFVMYVPGEPHMCNIVMPEAEVGHIKKICFKVISDQYWDEA